MRGLARACTAARAAARAPPDRTRGPNILGLGAARFHSLGHRTAATATAAATTDRTSHLNTDHVPGHSAEQEHAAEYEHVPRVEPTPQPAATAAAATATTTTTSPPGPASGRSQARLAALRASGGAAPFSAFLTDTFGRQHTYLRISLTERCNLRCRYCMPAGGIALSPAATQLTTPEILALAELFVAQGVTKIRLTGGEPTVRRDFSALAAQLGALRARGLRELCITSNGLVLAKHLDGLVEAGLTGVNLSLDSLDPAMFELLTRRRGHARVLQCLDRIEEMNRAGAGVALKLNVVVMRGVNEPELLAFVELARHKDIEVRFIEYMPFAGNAWERRKLVPTAEMLETVRNAFPGLQKVEDAPDATARAWKVPGFKGRLAFISSMTDHFCGGCSRLRLTADGSLKVCLFGNAEVSLRDVLRGANEGRPIDQEAWRAMQELEKEGGGVPLAVRDELLDVIGAAVGRKKARHAGMDALKSMENRPMILIGDPLLTTQRPAVSRHSLRAAGWTLPPASATGVIPHSSSAARVLPHLASATSTTSHHPVARPVPFTPSTPGLPPRTLSARPVPLHLLTSGSGRHASRRLYHHHRRHFSTGPRYSSLNPNNTVPSPQSASSSASASPPAPPTPQSLPHLAPSGDIHVVSVAHKRVSHRTATAVGSITFSSAATLPLVRAAALRKGDALAVARVAGIAAAKRTADLVPLCHPGVALDGVRCWAEAVGAEPKVEPKAEPKMEPEAEPNVQPGAQPEKEARMELDNADPELAAFLRAPLGPHGGVRLAAVVECEAKTGVEMEALCAVAGAGLSVLDMVKAVDRHGVLGGVRAVRKSGGRSGDWVAERWD